MSRISRPPVWDSQKSAIKNPVLLIEGRTRRIVELDEIMTRPDGGRSVFAEPLTSQEIRTDPVKAKVKNSDGEDEIVTRYSRRTVKVFRRLNSPGGIRGESSKMTPGRPTDGDIANSNYGRLLDGFAGGWKRARKLFAASRGTTVTFKQDGETKTKRMMLSRSPIPEELRTAPPERAILYFPNEGKITSAGREALAVVCQTPEGWEVRDGSSAPTMITESEAKKLLAEKRAVLRNFDDKF